jgi:protease IV
VRCRHLILFGLFVMILSGCFKPKITIFPDTTEPLREHTLEGKGKGKVLLLPVQGFISESPRGGLFGKKPSTVEEVKSQLRKAEKAKDIKAVLLQVDSPGGTVTAGDMLYHELKAFKERTGAKLVAVLMGVGASGGYYISLPADYIMAHPTTIVGSIGVVFLDPKVSGLLDKVGVEVEVTKSGRNKDMGSPFRASTPEEKEIVRGLVDVMARRFLELVAVHRRLDAQALEEVSTARIYLGQEALRLGLVDKVGYLDDALAKARELANLPHDAKLVVYRRSTYPDDNLYNTSRAALPTGNPTLVDLGFAEPLTSLQGGCYYLWLPGGFKD